MTPREVALLLQEHGSGRGRAEADSASEIDSLLQERTDLLAAVLSSCKDLWSTKSEELDSIAEKLGDGSRDVAWRLPYGNSGILEFFIALLTEGHLRPKLHIHALRLIGNSCADTDENRARVVEKDRLLSITKHVADENLIPFNIPVIYNILVDYEPAQSLASKAHLGKQLVGLLSLPHVSKYAPFVPYICKILSLLVSQEGEASAADPATVRVLLTLATQPAVKTDVEDFISLLTGAVAYLASETSQSRLISDNQVPLLMDAFYHTHVGFAIDDIDDEDVVAQMKQLRSSLLYTLADVSGNDSFAPSYPLSHHVPQTLLDWIRANNLFLQSAACLALGNVSRSDAASIALVEDYRAHEPLVKLLSDPNITDSQLLHAACSFLKNLVIPPGNKSQLKDLLLPQCVPRLYSLDTLPQIQFAAVSLTRLLLLNCPSSVRQICTPLESSPAKSGDNEQTGAKSIISLYGRSDAEPTRLEAARCVAGICRVLHSTPVSDIFPEALAVGTRSVSKEDEENLRSAFYASHAVQNPLRFLITQDKWPSLRSEAWFVFALMSRSSDGAAVVLSLLDDVAAEAVLTETLTGRKAESKENVVELEEESTADSTVQVQVQVTTSAASSQQLEPQQVDPKQKASVAKVDAENALILCTELVKLGESTLAPEKCAFLQGLVRDGTRRVVQDRQAEKINL